MEARINSRRTGPARKDSTGSAFQPSLLGRGWYRLVRFASKMAFFPLGGIQTTGQDNVPGAGGLLLVSNHSSYLDVFALGVAFPRPLNYVARSTLFFPPFGGLIRSVGAFPIQRDGLGAQGLKETLRRLRAGSAVLLFPEGTRTLDGELAPLKPGIASLASRARVPVVPAAIAGTFEAWPRDRKLPRRHRIHIHFGEPLAPDAHSSRDHDDMTAAIRTKILECQAIARSQLAARGAKAAPFNAQKN